MYNYGNMTNTLTGVGAVPSGGDRAHLWGGAAA